MSVDWQNSIVALVVLTAGGYLAWTGYRATRRRKAGCGACGTCPAGAAQEAAVVSIIGLAPDHATATPGRSMNSPAETGSGRSSD